MRELGMFSIASIIVGLPGETPEARERAVELAVEAGPDSAQFLPYLPLPGLPRDEWQSARSKRHSGGKRKGLHSVIKPGDKLIKDPIPPIL